MACVSMSTNLGAKAVADVIYQILMRHSRCRKKGYHIRTGYTYQPLSLRLKHPRKPPSNPDTLECFDRSERISSKSFWAALNPRRDHLSPGRDGSWQNLCHGFQRHSCGCQMSCSIWVYWQDWTRLAGELLADFWCESSGNKRQMVER